MEVEALELPGVVRITPRVFGDARGYFLETWNRRRYADAGVDVDFVQANVSRSERGVLRGLHYQWPNPQGKLVHVLEGRIWDVAVDLRQDSPTFRRWIGVELGAEDHGQLYVPPGFGHGFCVLSEWAVFSYLCTALYDAQADAAVRWDDPELAIDWPVAEPRLSAKDAGAPLLRDVPAARLPRS